MKKLIIGLLAMSLFSCKKEDSKPLTDSRLIGSWEFVELITTSSQSQSKRDIDATNIFGEHNTLIEHERYNGVTATNEADVSVKGDSLFLTPTKGWQNLPGRGLMNFNNNRLVVTTVVGGLTYTYVLER